MKPGIDLKQPWRSMEAVPDGHALVVGRVDVQKPGFDGLTSVRLVSFNELFGRSPYGEREVLLGPHGSFQWILPPGEYVIQPIYLHSDYTRHHYRSTDSVAVALSFVVPAPKEVYNIGQIAVEISAEFELKGLAVTAALSESLLERPRAVENGSAPIRVSLARPLPDPEYIVVPYRKMCRKWNMPSWCIITPGAGVCFDVDRG